MCNWKYYFVLLKYFDGFHYMGGYLVMLISVMRLHVYVCLYTCASIYDPQYMSYACFSSKIGYLYCPHDVKTIIIKKKSNNNNIIYMLFAASNI